VSHTHPTQKIYSNTNLHVVSTYSTMDKKVCLPVGARSLGWQNKMGVKVSEKTACS
jgi:hypothetical protein